MSENDTIKLLRECNSGIQMAVFSIDEILEKVTDGNLYDLLEKSKEKHEERTESDCKRNVLDENQRQSHDR